MENKKEVFKSINGKSKFVSRTIDYIMYDLIDNPDIIGREKYIDDIISLRKAYDSGIGKRLLDDSQWEDVR